LSKLNYNAWNFFLNNLYVCIKCTIFILIAKFKKIIFNGLLCLTDNYYANRVKNLKKITVWHLRYVPIVSDLFSDLVILRCFKNYRIAMSAFWPFWYQGFAINRFYCAKIKLGCFPAINCKRPHQNRRNRKNVIIYQSLASQITVGGAVPNSSSVIHILNFLIINL